MPDINDSMDNTNTDGISLFPSSSCHSNNHHVVFTLVIDFYDSYTYNLVDMIELVTGRRPKVVLCDDK